MPSREQSKNRENATKEMYLWSSFRSYIRAYQQEPRYIDVRSKAGQGKYWEDLTALLLYLDPKAALNYTKGDPNSTSFRSKITEAIEKDINLAPFKEFYKINKQINETSYKEERFNDFIKECNVKKEELDTQISKLQTLIETSSDRPFYYGIHIFFEKIYWKYIESKFL